MLLYLYITIYNEKLKQLSRRFRLLLITLSRFIISFLMRRNITQLDTMLYDKYVHINPIKRLIYLNTLFINGPSLK